MLAAPFSTSSCPSYRTLDDFGGWKRMSVMSAILRKVSIEKEVERYQRGDEGHGAVRG
jgi:hypothetical protein